MNATARAPMDGVRRYTWWTLVTGAALVAGVLVLTLVAADPAGPTGAALLVAAAVVVLGYVRITAAAMPGLRESREFPGERWVCLAVAVGAWLGAATTASDLALWALLPACAVAAIAVHRTGVARWVVVGGAAVGLAVLALLLVDRSDDPDWDSARGAISVGLLVVAFAGSNFLQVWLWAVVRRVDQARVLAADLAVAEERLRFAADLHDIQGHHLQVIALKAELAERLVGHDDDAARTQAAEVGELARTALRETRAVVHGYRRSSLSTEIGNAVDILRAAGIAATVTGEAGGVPGPLRPLFGALVREGTTNVLRHSSARTCEITVSTAGDAVAVELANDGVDAVRGGDRGSGLASLRERFAGVGGSVRVEDGEGWFRVVGEVRATGVAR